MGAGRCRTCASLSGDDPISPAAPIHAGRLWSVEHAYPTSLVGWVVLVPRRHVEAVHDLTVDETTEMADLLGVVTRALREQTGCLKEYVCCFAEAEGFAHVHVHVIPRSPDLEPELRGPGVFQLIGTGVEPASAEQVRGFCASMAALVAGKIRP